jgi:hypothetical protein
VGERPRQERVAPASLCGSSVNMDTGPFEPRRQPAATFRTRDLHGPIVARGRAQSARFGGFDRAVKVLIGAFSAGPTTAGVVGLLPLALGARRSSSATRRSLEAPRLTPSESDDCAHVSSAQEDIPDQDDGKSESIAWEVAFEAAALSWSTSYVGSPIWGRPVGRVHPFDDVSVSSTGQFGESSLDRTMEGRVRVHHGSKLRSWHLSVDGKC